MSKIYCNPDICPYCEYHSHGDSFCDIVMDFVLEDWEPTDSYMNAEMGCPYAQ